MVDTRILAMKTSQIYLNEALRTVSSCVAAWFSYLILMTYLLQQVDRFCSIRIYQFCVAVIRIKQEKSCKHLRIEKEKISSLIHLFSFSSLFVAYCLVPQKTSVFQFSRELRCSENIAHRFFCIFDKS